MSGIDNQIKKLNQYKSPPRYQKDVNIYRKKITPEYHIFPVIFRRIPPHCTVLDIACAEGFLCHLAAKAGILNVVGIEIGEEKIALANQQFGCQNINFICDSIFNQLHLIKQSEVIICSRFFHNIGPAASHIIMDEINKKKEFLLIVKYKPGLYKENGEKRQPLATRSGLKRLFKEYRLLNKSLSNEIILVSRGERWAAKTERLKNRYGIG